MKEAFVLTQKFRNVIDFATVGAATALVRAVTVADIDDGVDGVDGEIGDGKAEATAAAVITTTQHNRTVLASSSAILVNPNEALRPVPYHIIEWLSTSSSTVSSLPLLVDRCWLCRQCRRLHGEGNGTDSRENQPTESPKKVSC